jgi:ketosteroid isomerase-like protein
MEMPMSEMVSNVNAGQHAAIIDEIIAGMHAYEGAVKRLDAEATIAFYIDSPDFRFYDGGQPATYAEMAAGVRAMFDGLKEFRGGFEAIQVTVLGASAAIATSPYVDILTDHAGAVTELRGSVSWAWVHTPSGWRIIHGNALHVGEDGAAVRPIS